ncbi:RDD family protein [Echinimonas agarilytica]|uniref:RDD family protein n=1 Tax=Echinimonas agarilytica TaxID=1215918 RepID=A0AA42B8R0_9GAMM|nr:RDD family protein [Echinimonas agarilytica]MCM2680798.1 RDD family protein [Echinimonas agarilytica]
MEETQQMTEQGIEQAEKSVTYIGFWKRVLSSIIDSLLLMLVTLPILFAIYGIEYFTSEQPIQGWADGVVNYVLPIAIVIFFWLRFAATPGKMVWRGVIVDARTLGPMSGMQCALRYIGYIISTVPLCLGFIWIAFDDKKQGWHDKIARTVVIERDE